MMTTNSFFNVRFIGIIAAILTCFSTIQAQNDMNIFSGNTPNLKKKNTAKTASNAEKNANDLRKTILLLAIAQDRDRQAAEALEDIRSRRLRTEEDLLDADDNPKNFTKKQRADLESQLKSLQKKEKIAHQNREIANAFLLEVTQTSTAESAKRSKFIDTYEKKFGPVNDSKPNDSFQPETLAKTEQEPSKSVAVIEKSKKTPTTPSVQSPNLSENSTEMSSESVVPTSKKKKEMKAKQNESPSKIAQTDSKKKTKKTAETQNSSDDFQIVATQNMPNPTVEEQPIESKKEVKKAAKKESKKKTKKVELPTETPTKADDFPVVFSEPTPQDAPKIEPKIEEKVANPTEPNAEVTPNSDAETVENNVKSNKKASKKDKKSKKNSESENPQGSLVSYKSYERNVDVFMASPPPDCAIAFEGKDEFTGKIKRETKPARFFAHTDEVMRKALQDKDFIVCDLTGTKVESSRYTYLNMTITILSKDVQRSIGFLDRGTPIIFVLVDGSKVNLKTNKTDIGVVDIDKGTTTYRAQLTAESITDLTKSELDYVRVNWSSGYEDYEVYDVDILKNLFNCLYKK